MLPMLRQGIDSVVLSPVTGKLKKYDIPLYVRENGHYILHRIIDARGDTYTCVGDNQFEKEYGVEQSSILAVVSEFTRNGKSHSVNEFGYKAYCKFWYYSRPIRCLCKKAKTFARRVFRALKSRIKNKRRK